MLDSASRDSPSRTERARVPPTPPPARPPATLPPHSLCHPPQAPLRPAPAGLGTPAHFITDVKATCAGTTGMECRFSQSVAQNPYLAFKFKGGAKGAQVQVSWVDTKGDKRSDEATIS